jgi:hypothetical protein
MEFGSQTDQHAAKGTEESLNNSCLQSLSENMQSLSISMEVDKPTPKEDEGIVFRVTLIRIRYFPPICEYHRESDDAVDHAYTYIQERFSHEKFYFDHHNGYGGTIIVRARSMKNGSVCGVAMIEKVKEPLHWR